MLFTTPEVGVVGLSYAEAPAHGIQAAVARHDARGSGNSVATGEDAGYFKLIFDQHTRRLIGAQILSPAAAELIQLCALAIRSARPRGRWRTSLGASEPRRAAPAGLRARAARHAPAPGRRRRRRIAPVIRRPLRRAALWMAAAVLVAGCAGSSARSGPAAAEADLPARSARSCTTGCG